MYKNAHLLNCFVIETGVDIDLTLCKREILRDAKPYLFQILTSAMQVIIKN